MKPKTLKITDEDYLALSAAVKATAERLPTLYERTKQVGLSDMNYNWDILHRSGFDFSPLYSYLTEDHLNSALAHILGNSGKHNVPKVGRKRNENTIARAVPQQIAHEATEGRGKVSED